MKEITFCGGIMRLKNGDSMIWPEGKRIAVMITFDFDAEYLRYSVIGKKTIGFSDRSRGQYGPHEGLKRCLDMLKRQGIQTTFFIPGKVVEEYPDEVKAIAADGHELACHGYDHDNTMGVPQDQEEQGMEKSEELLSAVSGKKPCGYRGPLDTIQTYTIGLLQKRGYLYNSTLKDCDWAYIHDGSSPLVEIPTEPGIDDFSYFYFSYADEATITASYDPEYVYQIWQDYFDELASEGDKVMCLKLHPQLIGRSGRIRMVERLILHMKQNGAWIASCEEVARHVRSFYSGKKGSASL